jgi:GntR family transcriptional regulator / MocR family aminotransferase
MWEIEVSRQSELPLARQIYRALSESICAGRLAPGTALPSTRELAAHLAVSRNTVNEAYELLLAEGFILTRPGAPTRVAEGVFLEQPAPPPPAARSAAPPAPLVDFRTGQPDLQHFPRYLWNRLLRRAADDLPLDQLGYTRPEGLRPLREALAAWLFRSRGLAVDPAAIFVTAGATQALHLLADLLAQAGRPILVEDPCHSGMLRALQSKGCPIRPVPVDRFGLQTEALALAGAGAVYVTPSHQFPLGGILPASRRTALVRLARAHGVYIIEDDYDSEFRYSGAPVAPLHALDPQQVIYVGTFSKILFPALRIGYAILPEALRAPWCDLRRHADVQNPPFEQAALAEFIGSRKLDRHIQKMRRLYRQRRAALLEALADTFGAGWRAWGDAAGLHLAVEFPGQQFDRDFEALCQRHRLHAIPVAQHSIQTGTHQDKLLLGYGHLEPAEIRKGVRLLQRILASR